ncbi:barnase inhibitor [bacterium]|nr:MAG: barnase inhibitor [bacterium]
MAVFDDNSIREEWPIFELFRSGPVALFHKPPILQEMVTYFEERGYIVHDFACSAYVEKSDVLREVGARLDFPFEVSNLDGFNDFLGDVKVPIESGLVLVFTNFDSFHGLHPHYAQQILEIIADQSRNNLLCGRRFIALVQSNDPSIKLEPIGARSTQWNRKEWLDKDRLAL